MLWVHPFVAVLGFIESEVILCMCVTQRDLWRTFAHGVISFRRGLMDLETAEDFKSYLREEVVRGSSGSHKKMVGTKVSGTHTLPSLCRGAYVQTFTYKCCF